MFLSIDFQIIICVFGKVIYLDQWREGKKKQKERCFIIKFGNGLRLKIIIQKYRIISNKKRREMREKKNDNLIMKVFLGYCQDIQVDGYYCYVIIL